MKCYQCNTTMEVIKDQPYTYDTCGLDNVIIFGIPQYKCHECGEVYVSVPKIKQLHQVVAVSLCCQKERLSGKELRFLRKEMRLKASEFAAVLSIDPSTLSRIENGHETPSEPLEKFIRSTYISMVNSTQEEPVCTDWVEILKHVAKLPMNPDRKIALNPGEWLEKMVPERCMSMVECTA